MASHREQREAMCEGGEAEAECVVCFREAQFYSVGECDHPVCFECSTRMRVLCLQNECPICRQPLRKVIFTPDCLPFKELSIQQFPNHFFEKTYKIGFVTEAAKSAYMKLLEHNCGECKGNSPSFANFEGLLSHVRSVHDLFYCDLCVNNLKIFTAERKCYTRQQLMMHKRKGDPDDSSHKGHPLCKFCEERFMDTDELYRHLRKQHLYCHMCDADGYDYYYESYDALNDHFRKDHFTCEEGECSQEALTSVFRTDVDLIAHKAQEHGKGLSRQAARQARTLEVQFTLTPRPPTRPRGPPPPHVYPERTEVETVRDNISEEAIRSMTNIAIDTGSKEQFPSLGTGSATPVLTVTRPATLVLRQTTGALARTDKNFPALGDGPAPTPTLRVNITTQPGPTTAGPSNAIIKTSSSVLSTNIPPKPNVSIQLHNRQSASHFKIEATTKPPPPKFSEPKCDDPKRFEDEFPTLRKKDKNLLLNDYCSPLLMSNTMAKKLSSTNTTIVQTVAPKPAPISFQSTPPPPPSSNAFPALCPTSYVPQQPQWIVASKPREKPKPSKVAPAPVLPTVTDINNASDFPSLAIINRNKNKKPVKNDVVSTRQPEPEKKDKKKKANEGSKIILTIKTKKNIPPDNSNNKTSKEPKLVPINGKKNEEPLWVECKTKKSTTTNNNNNKTDEKNNNTVKVEKKEKFKVIQHMNKKIDSPNLVLDFPALNEGKGIPGFRNKPTGDNSVSNDITKLSYSENLKRKTEANKENVTENGISTRETTPTPTFNGSVPPCNGLTFTNSSGQSYKIPVHNYLQPPDFNERNKALVVNFMNALGSPDSIQEFKEISRQFRDGIFSAEFYYEHCRESIGGEFEVLFPELLVLLPDISKQQELHKIHNELSFSNLVACSTCGQILIPSDSEMHYSSHATLSNFPELSSTVHPTSGWRK